MQITINVPSDHSTTASLGNGAPMVRRVYRYRRQTFNVRYCGKNGLSADCTSGRFWTHDGTDNWLIF